MCIAFADQLLNSCEDYNLFHDMNVMLIITCTQRSLTVLPLQDIKLERKSEKKYSVLLCFGQLHDAKFIKYNF